MTRHIKSLWIGLIQKILIWSLLTDLFIMVIVSKIENFCIKIVHINILCDSMWRIIFYLMAKLTCLLMEEPIQDISNHSLRPILNIF